MDVVAGHGVYSDIFDIILDLSSSHPWSSGRGFFVWCFTSTPRRLLFRYWDARMDVGVTSAAVNFPYFFFFVFIELIPCDTDADPASHGVRLWRGGSASTVAFFLFFPFFVFVYTHFLEVPLAPTVGQRGDGDVGASPRSACERYVRCALPVCSLCLIMFSFPSVSFNN